MNIDVIRPCDLDTNLEQRWSELQESSPNLGSPFFSVEYTKIVGLHRPDAFIAIIHRAGTPVAFFPFHRRTLGRGDPIGGLLTDYHGFIAEPAFEFSVDTLLTNCRLDSYDYNHGLQSQGMLSKCSFFIAESPAIDLSLGFDSWLSSRNKHTQGLKTVQRKLRKVQRELGPLRFVPDDKTSNAWSKFIDWKNISYSSKNTRSIIDIGWVQGVLDGVRHCSRRNFSGMLSTVYAGDSLIAAHFGMRSAVEFHWWFPTYDPSLGKYSPGLILLLECARWSSDQGIVWLDLGRGPDRYKRMFANRARTLCEGSFERTASLAGGGRRLRKIADTAARAVLPKSFCEFQRRGFNRVLRAGLSY